MTSIPCGASAAELADDAAEYDKAARNAEIHAKVQRNAARHHMDAAERLPHAKTFHHAAAERCEAAATRHAAAADRHRAKAEKARQAVALR